MGSVPVAVADFMMGPGVPIFYLDPVTSSAKVMSSAQGMYFRELNYTLLLVSIPEPVDYGDFSGDEGPDYYSYYCQPADKPCLGQSSSEEGDSGGCFGPYDRRIVVNIGWLALFGYRRHCLPLCFLV